MKNTTQHLGRLALSGVAFASLALACNLSWALGLGRLSVQSTLGETLRAEIDVTSLTPEEASNLKVRIASPDAYRSAGIEYNAVLPSAQATLLRRADGRPFLRLTSDKVVQEPFVDVILELSWASGRLVREYTLLFDPPSERALAAAPASAPEASTSPVFSSPAAAPQPVAKPRAAAPASAPAAPAPAPAAERAPKPAATAAAPAGPSADEYRVRSGDTLTGIAAKTRREGVSLDQMLVSLYRTNPQAFIENNMNRLKSGVTLAVPSSDSAGAIPPAEARQVIQAQSADFGAFRQRLAGAVPAVQADAPARKDTGTVQASIDDRKSSTASAPDKLTLSKGAAAAKGASEAKVSKELEAKDTSTRVAELSKNVDELKKLSGAASATVSAQAGAAASSPIAAGPAVTPAAPVVAAPASAAAADPSASAAAPVVTAAPASAAKPAARPPAPVPTPEEPSLVDSLLADPLTLGAGGVVIAALIGFGVYRARKSKVDSGETSFLESRLQPDSFFGASGGQRIDTREAATGAPSSMSYSLSQLDAIGDVDPVAEADVYLAYGRDLQAEEILKEALRATPDRMAIRTKLLEVYAKRRDTKGYELLAIQLHSLTSGSGEDWEKAQSMGREIDPDNELYQPGGAPDSALDRNGGAISEPLGASTMPQSVLPTPSTFGSAPADALSSDGGGVVDLDLDLDKGSFSPESTEPALESFNFEPAPTPAAAQAYYPQTPPAAAPAPSAPDFDLSDISLDLDAPDSAVPTGAIVDEAPDVVIDDEADDPNVDPMARKLELAEEFRQIGDVEGARDLLQEVAAKADGALKAKAQGMLDDLR